MSQSNHSILGSLRLLPSSHQGGTESCTTEQKEEEKESAGPQYGSIIAATLCTVVFLILGWSQGHNDRNHPEPNSDNRAQTVVSQQPQLQQSQRTQGQFGQAVLEFIDNYNRLSPVEQQQQLPLLQSICFELFKATLATTKSEWDRKTVDQQTNAINFLEFVFEVNGLPKSDTHALSLFLGPFMQSAPSHATVEDGVVQYFQMLRRQQNAQAADDLMKVLRALQIGAEVVDSLSRASQ